MTIRAGVIGLGAMGRHHARLLRSMSEYEFVGAVDGDGDRFGALVEAKLVDSVEDLIELGIDAAVVAVPTVDHRAVALKLAEAGVATMVEKPLAESANVATEIAEAFDSSGILGAVGHVERFNPALIELRRRLGEHELGRVFSVTTQRVGPFPHRVRDVGVVKDLATHDIDIIRWLTRSSPQSVAAVTAHQMGREHEDLVSVVGSLPGGEVIRLDVNWLTPTKRRTVTVLGEKGAFVADLITSDLTLYSNADTPSQWDALARLTGVSEGDMVRYAIEKPEPLQSELAALARSIETGSISEIATMAEGVAVLGVAEAVLRSAVNGTTEKL